MQSLAKGNQWFFGMRCHVGVDLACGLVHEVVSMLPAVVSRGEEFQNCSAEFRIATKPGQCLVLLDSPEGQLLDLVEAAKVHFRSKVEHLFRIIKCQFGFRKIFFRGFNKIDLKLKLLFVLTNLLIVRE